MSIQSMQPSPAPLTRRSAVQTLSHSDGRPSDVDLSIIIVNWNTRDLLADCLRSVYDTVHDLEYEVFVVDNASSDGSAAMVREQFPGVRLVENAENVGFASANNQAIAQATGTLVLLLNPDTVVRDDAILWLAAFLDQYLSYGIAGAQLLNADGSVQDSWGWYPDLQAEIPVVNRLRIRPRARLVAVAGVGQLAILDVPWLSGACLMFRRELYADIDGLDESFWLYSEETDWCYRARRAGHSIALVTTARIRHLRRAASRQRMVVSMLWYYQSRVRFMVKHHSRFPAWIVKTILRLKAAMWQRSPDSSPLRVAYPEAPGESIEAAYRQLRTELGRSVRSLLAQKW